MAGAGAVCLVLVKPVCWVWLVLVRAAEWLVPVLVPVQLSTVAGASAGTSTMVPVQPAGAGAGYVGASAYCG